MATRAKAKEPARKPGRPSKYKDEFPEQARKLCLLGATDKDMAGFFGVSEQTVNAWKGEHPEFLESIKKGKELADATVAESLYHRANGYSHPDVHISNFQGAITITPLTKHYPPDTAAGIFWLKNRRPDRWRDKPGEGGAEDPAEFLKRLKEERSRLDAPGPP